MSASSIVVALVLAQAGAPAPDPARPPVPLGPSAAPAAPPRPAPAAAATQAAPVLRFRDAIELARTQNLEIQQLNARVEQARQLAWKAWSFYLPQVNVAGSYTRNELEASFLLPSGYYIRDLGAPQGPGPNDPTQPESPSNPPGNPTNLSLYPSSFDNLVVQKLDQLQGQVQLSQALIAPQLWPTIANAYTAERVVDYNAQQARRDVLFAIAQLYYGIAGLKQLELVQERQVELTRERERDAKVRYDAGTSPKVALLRAEIDRAQAEEDLKRAQIDYRKAKLALATALDRADDFEIEIPRSPEPPRGDDLERQALELRPDVKAALEGVTLAEGQRTQAIMRYLPSIGGFANYRYANATAFTGKATTWQAGLGLSWTILDGGLREAEIREGSARIAEARAAQQAADNRAVEQVRRFQLELEAAVANKAKARERTELARENARLVDVAYKAGAATYLESTDSVQTLRQAEVGLVAESLNVDLATLRLLNAVGAFGEVNR